MQIRFTINRGSIEEICNHHYVPYLLLLFRSNDVSTQSHEKLNNSQNSERDSGREGVKGECSGGGWFRYGETNSVWANWCSTWPQSELFTSIRLESGSIRNLYVFRRINFASLTVSNLRTKRKRWLVCRWNGKPFGRFRWLTEIWINLNRMLLKVVQSYRRIWP